MNSGSSLCAQTRCQPLSSRQLVRMLGGYWPVYCCLHPWQGSRGPSRRRAGLQEQGTRGRTHATRCSTPHPQHPPIRLSRFALRRGTQTTLCNSEDSYPLSQSGRQSNGFEAKLKEWGNNGSTSGQTLWCSQPTQAWEAAPRLQERLKQQPPATAATER